MTVVELNSVGFTSGTSLPKIAQALLWVSQGNIRSRKRHVPSVNHIEDGFPTPGEQKRKDTEPYHRHVHEPDAHDRGSECLAKHTIGDEFKGNCFRHIRGVDFGEGVSMLAHITFGSL
jgi:hypothetical protein